jgi:hypothetical protein
MALFDRLLKGKKPDYGLLEEILNRPSSNSGGYSGSSGHGFHVAGSETLSPETDMYTHRGIYQIDTPEGYRYYPGQGSESYDIMTTRKDAGLDAAIRAMEFPGDSLTTDQYNQFYNYGMWDK